MVWLQNQVINNTRAKDAQEMTDLGIEFTFRDAPDNAGDGTKYYLSNSIRTSNFTHFFLWLTEN